MERSIATESWQVNADDPVALTALLDLRHGVGAGARQQRTAGA